jgi:hypothetical protein
MRPINPVFPVFTFNCSVCGRRADSYNGAAGDEPFTYVCFIHFDEATRNAVWQNNNAAVRETRVTHPEQVAELRRYLGIKRPFHVPHDLSWAGCEVESFLGR